MEMIHASIGRIVLFVVLLLGVLGFLIHDAVMVSADRHKQLIAKVLPTPTAVPTPTPSPSPTDTPTPTPLPTKIPTPTILPTSMPTVVQAVSAADDSVWDRLADCESHQHWTDNTGNGYYGGLQFSLSAWASVGGTGKPSDASKDEQVMRGKMLQSARGWAPWGACSRSLGLR